MIIGSFLPMLKNVSEIYGNIDRFDLLKKRVKTNGCGF